ncbi:MAG: class I adenylate-forming enzyme family protein [bacterium]|nr:class I adenylate-forming enzyme family protein [bacterium]
MKEKTVYPSVDKAWLKYFKQLPGEIPKMGAYEYIFRQNQDNLNGNAICYMGEHITYKALFDKVDRLAMSFKEQGIKEGDCVVVFSLTTPEVAMSFLALNKLGVVVNMIDPRNGEEALIDLIASSNATVLMSTDILNEKVSSIIERTAIQKIINFSYLNSLSNDKKDKIGNSNIKPLSFSGKYLNGDLMFNNKNKLTTFLPYEDNRVAAIVYTGGTTGKPKGVMLSDNTFVAMAYQYSFADVCMEKGDTSMCVIPLSFPYGLVFCLYTPIANKAENILIHNFDATQIPDLIFNYQPNHIMGVPKYAEILINDSRCKEIGLSFLKVFGVGGTSLSVAKEKEINKIFQQCGSPNPVMKGYGMSELGGPVLSSLKRINPVGSVGVPLPCNEVGIFDENNNELSYGQIGEICCNGPTTMIGYKGNVEATNTLIRKHNDGKLWVHSEDLGIINEDGTFVVLDRAKNVINRRGMNIYPAHIEDIIAMCDEVAEVAVGKKDDRDLDEVPVAWIVPKIGCTDFVNLENEVKKLIANYLPPYSWPVDYYYIDKIPLTKIGKVNIKALEATLKTNKKVLKKR